jgi:hypothetical protein
MVGPVLLKPHTERYQAKAHRATYNNVISYDSPQWKKIEGWLTW